MFKCSNFTILLLHGQIYHMCTHLIKESDVEILLKKGYSITVNAFTDLGSNIEADAFLHLCSEDIDKGEYILIQ